MHIVLFHSWIFLSFYFSKASVSSTYIFKCFCICLYKYAYAYRHMLIYTKFPSLLKFIWNISHDELCRWHMTLRIQIVHKDHPLSLRLELVTAFTHYSIYYLFLNALSFVCFFHCEGSMKKWTLLSCALFHFLVVM